MHSRRNYDDFDAVQPAGNYAEDTLKKLGKRIESQEASRAKKQLQEKSTAGPLK